MKTYVIVTGVIFALITLAHIWRVIEEGSYLASEPLFVVLTCATAALSIWALRLVMPRRARNT
jgi:hypothetical protein